MLMLKRPHSKYCTVEAN